MPGWDAPARRPAGSPPSTTAPNGPDGPAGLDGLPADSILRTFHPAVASWFLRSLPRRAHRATASGVAADHLGTRRAGRLPDRDRQDADRIPGGHRRRLPGPGRRASRPRVPAAPGSSTSRRCGPWPSTSTRTCSCPLAGIAEEAARLGLAAPDLSVAVRTGDTPAGGAGGHAPVPARPAGHHAGVPLPAAHGGIVPGHAAGRAHGDRRRGAHPGPRQAGRASGAEPRAAERSSWRPRGPTAAHRPVGHPATARGGGRSPVGVGSVPVLHRHRRLRPPAGPRRGHRAPPDRARGGGQRLAALRRARPHRRPRPRAPHHPGLRQHPQDGRAGRPPAGHPARIAGRDRAIRRPGDGGSVRPSGCRR